MAIIKSKHPGFFVQWFLSFPRTEVLVGSLTMLHRFRQKYREVNLPNTWQGAEKAAGVVSSLIIELLWSHRYAERAFGGPRTQILRTDSPKTA